MPYARQALLAGLFHVTIVLSYFVDGAAELPMQVTTFEQGWGSKQMG